MTRDTDLIRRALLNIREISMTLADEYGNPWVDSHMIEREVAAALAALSAPAQEPPSPGVTARAMGPERIWAWSWLTQPRGQWSVQPSHDTIEYIRADLATPVPVVPAEGLAAAMDRLQTEICCADGDRADAAQDHSDGSERVDLWPHTAEFGVDDVRMVLTALRSAPPVGARVIAEKAYLAGFNAAGEGYNGEWPFHDKGISPDTDEGWLIGRDMALAALLPAGEGE